MNIKANDLELSLAEEAASIQLRATSARLRQTVEDMRRELSVRPPPFAFVSLETTRRYLADLSTPDLRGLYGGMMGLAAVGMLLNARLVEAIEEEMRGRKIASSPQERFTLKWLPGELGGQKWLASWGAIGAPRQRREIYQPQELSIDALLGLPELPTAFPRNPVEWRFLNNLWMFVPDTSETLAVSKREIGHLAESAETQQLRERVGVLERELYHSREEAQCLKEQAVRGALAEDFAAHLWAELGEEVWLRVVTARKALDLDRALTRYKEALLLLDDSDLDRAVEEAQRQVKLRTDRLRAVESVREELLDLRYGLPF